MTGPILIVKFMAGIPAVSISMERLADIVDQVPESGEREEEQIALPPIKGNIKFEDVRFRFGKTGSYQIDEVNLEIMVAPSRGL